MKELTLEAYLMSRDKAYADEFNIELKSNALDLIKRVNNLLNALQIDCPPVTSGWRPLAVNLKAGGAKRSLHMLCKAVDLADKDGIFKQRILEKPELLLEFGLWLEEPTSCPGWAHLDTGVRFHRPIRVFKP